MQEAIRSSDKSEASRDVGAGEMQSGARVDPAPQKESDKNDWQAHEEQSLHHYIPSKLVNLSNYRQLLTLLQVFGDVAAVFLSFVSGYALWNWIGPHLTFELYELESISRYNFFLGVSLLTVLVGFRANGLYHAQRSLMNVREFELILKTWLMACGVTLGILFLSEQLYFSRGIFVLTWVCMLGFFMIERYAFFKFNSFFMACGFIETTALIYGAGVVGQKLLGKFRESPKLGYHVAGFIDDNTSIRGRRVQSVPVLGDFAALKDIIKRTQAKKLFIALPQVPSKVVIDIMNVCRQTGCEFQIVPSLYDIVIQRVKITEIEGIPLIGVREPRYNLRTMIAKRVFDCIASTFLLVFLSPVFLLIAAIVKLTSPGPIIFSQERVGKNGRRFQFYKFRSMFTHAPVYAETPKHSFDPRITPIGRLLRRSSLDELPQLWNVLKGDMSLVGPRPEMPFIVEQYNELQRQRLNVKPGITGLWQISADRKLAIHQNMDYDIYYIFNQSFLLDLVILAKTVTSCLRGVGAY